MQLVTAGIKDAKIKVSSPFQVSGTAAFDKGGIIKTVWRYNRRRDYRDRRRR